MNNILIISGPAGSGKDSVIEGLRQKISFERVITSTSRPLRSGESEGRPYHFLSRSAFEKGVADGNFIEYSTNENGELYGVTKGEIERVSMLSTLVLWKLDWKGVASAKKLFPNIRAVLISAPLPLLEERLRRRDGDHQDEAYFAERMAYTREWMKHTDLYDYIIENEEGKLDATIEKILEIIRGLDGSAPSI